MPSPRSRMRYLLPLIVLAAAVGVSALGFALAAPANSGGPAEFVGRSSCVKCHQQQHDEWSGSHHDLAMQEPSEGAVLADFDGSTFEHQGVTTRFFRDGEKFMVRTEGPDGELQDYTVEYAFGVEPLQQYLLKMDGGRLQALSIAWDTEKQEWFHLYPDRKIEPDSSLHWTGRLQNWNRQCASCHSTDLRKNYDPESDAYHTEYAELDVSCEACHGPGSKHVDWANANSLTRMFYGGNYGLSTDVKSHYPETTPATEAAELDIRKADSQINACFLCHARRGQVHPEYTHGESFYTAFKPELLQEPLYHPDGQINEEVYVFGSYTQSKMYHQGVACTDCHNPHTTKLKATGNALCLRCHDAGKYESREHHFHEPGTAGASCVECHMPEKTYMQVDPRRDHSIRIPRPDLSAEFGTPNACNRCHTEEDAQWAADVVEEHHGPERPGGADFAPTIAAGRDGDPGALEDLVELAEDEDSANIVRATALRLLNNYPQPEAADTLRNAVDSDDPMMRVTAVAGLDRLPPPDRLAAAAPLLKDPMRVVRMEAARLLSAVPGDEFNEKQSAALDEALAEYKEGQRALLDGPDGHLNLGNLYDNLGQSQKAVEHFEAAAAMDPELIPPRMNLAHLYNRLGENDNAEQRLREVLEHRSDYGEAHYSLGLLLAENPQRIQEAAHHLGRAAQLMPDRPRVLYNYSLALQRINRGSQAEQVLLRAHDLAPESPDILNALTIYYMKQRRWSDAYTYAEKLAKQFPNNRNLQNRLNQIRQQMLR